MRRWEPIRLVGNLSQSPREKVDGVKKTSILLVNIWLLRAYGTSFQRTFYGEEL
jgi:hypothetical protein